MKRTCRSLRLTAALLAVQCLSSSHAFGPANAGPSASVPTARTNGCVAVRLAASEDGVVDEGAASPRSTSLYYAMDPDSEDAARIMTDLGLSSVQQKQMKALATLVVEWNDRINLVSRKDCSVPVVFGRHVLPCLGYLGEFGGPVLDHTVSRIVDVGTGGGFPGLPLAVAYPHVEFLLVDSVGKKLAAVENMAQRLGLTNVKVHHGRAEHIVDPFDVCVGRSVAAIPRFCFWVQNLIDDQNGKLAYMIGGDIEDQVLDLAIDDVSIDALLNHRDVSDKRILVFPKSSVKQLAEMSGLKPIKPSEPSKKNKNKNAPKRKRRAKGEWRRRDPSSPKQRGYENFQRYDSTQAQ